MGLDVVPLLRATTTTGGLTAMKPDVPIRFPWSTTTFKFNAYVNVEASKRMNVLVEEEIIGVVGLKIFYRSGDTDEQCKNSEIIIPMKNRIWLFCHKSNISEKCMCGHECQHSFEKQ